MANILILGGGFGGDSIYLHKGLWDHDEASVRQGRFWGWAKRAHERYRQAEHR